MRENKWETVSFFFSFSSRSFTRDLGACFDTIDIWETNSSCRFLILDARCCCLQPVVRIICGNFNGAFVVYKTSWSVSNNTLCLSNVDVNYAGPLSIFRVNIAGDSYFCRFRSRFPYLALIVVVDFNLLWRYVCQNNVNRCRAFRFQRSVDLNNLLPYPLSMSSTDLFTWITCRSRRS